MYSVTAKIGQMEDRVGRVVKTHGKGQVLKCKTKIPPS